SDGPRVAVGVHYLYIRTDAVDIVAHPPRRYYPSLVRVSRAHPADAEAVAPVDVGHGQAGVLDAGQERHLGHLLGRLGLLDLLQQALVREDQAVHAHALLVTFRDAPAALVHLLQRAVVGVFRHGSLRLSDVHDDFRQPAVGGLLDAEAVVGDRL